MATLKYRKNSSSPWETLKALPQTGTVRYDLAQSLDTTQQRMARSNIGAAAASDVANAVEYVAQSGFTNLQREQACENIGAVTYLMDQILNDTEKAQARKNLDIGHLYSSSGTGTIPAASADYFTPVLALPKGNYIVYGLVNGANIYDVQLFNNDVKLTGDPIAQYQRSNASSVAICVSEAEIQFKAKISLPPKNDETAYAYLFYALAIS